MNPSECPVLLISLERATEKRQRAIAALEELGLVRHQWVRAVDGRAMSAEDRALEYDAADSKKFSGIMSAAQVGCYLSHLKCHRMICEQNLPYAIVMEDDIRPMPALLKVLAQSERFPDDWGLIHLAPGLTEEQQRACGCANYVHQRHLFGPNYISKYCNQTYGTHLYLITPAYARKLATHLRPIRMPVDWAMFDIAYSIDYPYIVYQRSNHLYLMPETVCHTGVHSDITGKIPAKTTPGPTPARKTASSSPPRSRLRPGLGREIARKIAAQMRKVYCCVPWSDDGKSNCLGEGHPSPYDYHLILARSCQWHMLPLVIGRYLRARLAWQKTDDRSRGRSTA